MFSDPLAIHPFAHPRIPQVPCALDAIQLRGYCSPAIAILEHKPRHKVIHFVLPQVLGHEVRHILLRVHLEDWQNLFGGMVLKPQEIHVEMPHFVEAASLQDAYGRRSVRVKARSNLTSPFHS